ncbi:Predicted N-formylglutamate amidohydrolase [Dokdonella immobilis]|uniref:Predicted N-formylglutamate amidohydrolase n=1 Tax=Dokdonella immobilis TaxID=578942 RepID=A0A1I5AA29_9GAMM|nr:Predicted N-formylglutamate amidohydrolase [Dokdonella immobilis]
MVDDGVDQLFRDEAPKVRGQQAVDDVVVPVRAQQRDGTARAAEPFHIVLAASQCKLFDQRRVRHTAGMNVDAYTAPVHFHPGPNAAFLVVCDHASNAVPEEYQALGLPAHALEQHIAWDPGARGVSFALADRLECPVILGGSSRLLIDLNRDIDDASSITAEIDSTFVPANLAISDDERAQRVRRFFAPYHARIDAWLDEQLARRIKPVLISVHSFTPRFGSIERPWPIAVLWKKSRDPVAPLIDWFAAQGYQVGDNQPYDARVLGGHTLECHALRRNLAHVLFEIRNNEIGTVQQQQQWGERLHRAIVETRFGMHG